MALQHTTVGDAYKECHIQITREKNGNFNATILNLYEVTMTGFCEL